MEAPHFSRLVQRIAVIGGGISGLTAAFTMRRHAPNAEIHLYEASSRLGGPLFTQEHGEFVWEYGADSFTRKLSWGVDLCNDLGIGDELISTSTMHRRALVVCRGRLSPVPPGFVLMRPQRLGGLLRSSVLSMRGKLRLLAEPFVPRHSNALDVDHDESVASFARRRLGRETFERLVQPLLGGIYVADAEELSLAATMPEFLVAERDHGSLWHGRPTSSKSSRNDDAQGARYDAFVTPRRGLSQLISALAAKLDASSIHLETRVTMLSHDQAGGWRVSCQTGGAERGRERERGEDFGLFDGVIVATPAPAAAKLFKLVDDDLAKLLASIRYASSVVVNLGYSPLQFRRPIEGFGFVVPSIENMTLIAASFPSVKFEGRGSVACTPIRAFIGGANNPNAMEWDDARLIATARRELESLLDLTGTPQFADVARWPESMPQYRVGHVALTRSIFRAAERLQGCELAGNAYEGVGIVQCIRSGIQAAERLYAQLEKRPLNPLG